MDGKAERIALFRYGLIATLVLEKLPRGEMIRRARELAEHDYDIPFSDRRHISVETLLHWAARYRTGGLEALAPQPRSDRGKPRVIPPPLAQAIEARGVPVRLYVDNGKIYRSRQLERIGASVGILIVHTPPYQPEGRGKIERFFRTVREQFLAGIDRQHVRTVADLNSRFQVWLDSVYHREKHGSLETTPLQRWQRDIEHVRQLPPSTDTRRLFFYRVDRLVRRDSTFLVQRRFYEAPPHLAGRRVEVRFDPLDPIQMEIHFEGEFVATARPVDAVVNAQLPPQPKPEPQSPAATGINYVELLHSKEAGDV